MEPVKLENGKTVLVNDSMDGSSDDHSVNKKKYKEKANKIPKCDLGSEESNSSDVSNS